jgi:hypothetical protein
MIYKHALGAIALGVVIGWMAHVTFTQQKVTSQVFVAIVTVLVGPAVAGIFQAFAGTKASLPREVWFYPIGLLVGVSISALTSFIKAKGIAARAKELERLKNAKDRILSHMRNITKLATRQRGFEIMSFGILRVDLNEPNWTDEFFAKVIGQFPTELSGSTSAGERGIKDLQSPHRVSPQSHP